MSLLATLAPEGFKLLKQYLDEGKVEKSTLVASLSAVMGSLGDTTPADIDLLGENMEDIGKCLQQVAANYKRKAITTKPDSNGHTPELKPKGSIKGEDNRG